MALDTDDAHGKRLTVEQFKESVWQDLQRALKKNADYAQGHRSFLREAKVMMDFVHPNAIAVRDFGASGEGFLYMTLDYSPGVSLKELLDEQKRLSVSRSLELARQVLSALEEAHRKGIVHREEEILLTDYDMGRRDQRRAVDKLHR